MLQRTSSFKRQVLCVISTLALVASTVLAPLQAQALPSELSIRDAESAVQSSKLSLAEAKSELDRISAECSELAQEISDMQVEIDKSAEAVLEAQQKMLDGRDALSNAVKQNYKKSSSSVFLGMLLGSASFDELTQNATYINQIMDYQSNEIIEQKRLKDELDKVASDLNDQKNEQEAKLNALESKQAEVQAIVDRASQDLDESTEALNSLKAQAETVAQKAQASAQAAQTPNQSTITGEDSKPSSSAGSSSSSSSESVSVPTGEGWKSGSASAYGGSSDPSVKPGATTATGAAVNDSSMGVAVPMSMANYKSYFGRTVEIVYNGHTVYATVNDCGSMGGGSRVLDLQPGVFKAFGFSSCQAWGVRTVQYRFL